MSSVSVMIPARPDLLPLLVPVVASVAARHGLSYDSIEDLKIAVDEAAAYLLGLKSRAGRLCLRIEATGDGIEAVVWTDAPAATWPPDGADRTMARRVLAGLTDEVRFLVRGSSPAIRMVKRAIGER